MTRATPRTTVLVTAFAAQAVAGPLTLRDLAHRTDAEVRGPRLLWKLWAGTNLLGVAAYWAFGRR